MLTRETLWLFFLELTYFFQVWELVFFHGSFLWLCGSAPHVKWRAGLSELTETMMLLP